MAYEWRQSCSRLVIHGLSRSLSSGFPLLLHIIDSASDIRAGNWKYLATDESGDHYYCELQRHAQHGRFLLLCLVSYGNGAVSAAMSFCCVGQI